MTKRNPIPAPDFQSWAYRVAAHLPTFDYLPPDQWPEIVRDERAHYLNWRAYLGSALHPDAGLIFVLRERRVSIYGRYPNDADGREIRPTIFDKAKGKHVDPPSITVATTREPAHVAADIGRRFGPEYSRYFEQGLRECWGSWLHRHRTAELHAAIAAAAAPIGMHALNSGWRSGGERATADSRKGFSVDTETWASREPTGPEGTITVTIRADVGPALAAIRAAVAAELARLDISPDEDAA